ncbi:MAG: phospholipase domain protein [Labilithrix sp.]|nr:phospholipase domain protein [Labilithrix sp.]
MNGNFAEMFVDGHRILPALLRDLAEARRSIHVSMFLFFRDPVGEEVAALLSRRAREGLDVRVLINVEKTAMGDPFSTGEREMMRHDPEFRKNPMNVQPMVEQMREAGVLVHDTNIDYDLELPGLAPRLVSMAQQIRKGISIDDMHVDHRKLVIVDGRVGWCGGANIGAQYMYHVPFDPTKDAKLEAEERKKAGADEPWWKWHDSLTRFEGPIVVDLEAAFHDRWLLDGGEHYDSAPPLPAAGAPRGAPIGHAHVHCNAPSDEPNEVRGLYLRLIAEARRSIFIENPYFYHEAVGDALCEAKRARPELEITLVLPAGRLNDNAFGQDAQEHHYARFLDHDITVHEYQNHFNHLKMAVFDERYSIHGSTNLNYRSLEDDKDFELVVLVDDEPLARWILENVRDVDITHARRIGQHELYGTLGGLRRRIRDPRTLALLAKRVL